MLPIFLNVCESSCHVNKSILYTPVGFCFRMLYNALKVSLNVQNVVKVRNVTDSKTKYFYLGQFLVGWKCW